MDLNVIMATELTLCQPGIDSVKILSVVGEKSSGKRPFKDIDTDSVEIGDSHPPPAKSQVDGWPPIKTFRKDCYTAKKAATVEGEEGLMYVKVSMDGAPYLRKIDLKVYAGYNELIKALETMFKCFIQGEFICKEYCNKSDEFALTYEDKEGDWMLVGDVPFEMFITSCKRLRIMKKLEAQGFGSC